MGHRLAGELFDRPDRPTAVAACNDLMALGAMRAAQERGLVVGRDIAIAGFDGTDAAEYAHPPLTTIHQPVYEIGQQVVRMLLDILAGEDVGPPWPLITPKLVVRESTASLERD